MIDRESLLAHIEGAAVLATAERTLNRQGLTLDARWPHGMETLTVSEWLALGAPGTRDPWLDPADHLLAGLQATLHDGTTLDVRPAPRRSVGPDLISLLVGAHGRFGRIDRAWLRVHPLGVARPVSSSFAIDRDPPLSAAESALLDDIAQSLASVRDR